jgi:hypothetical protein
MRRGESVFDPHSRRKTSVMNLIRKTSWTMALLGLTAGCAGEGDDAAPTAGATSPPVVAKPAPSGIPPAPAIPTSGEKAKADEAPKVEGPKAESSKTDAKDSKLTAGDIAAIKELPEAEQAVASKQAVCPVSSHNLGSMGKPIKVTAEGRTFYICCDGCEDKVKTDPKAVIAKLDKK